jgi:outer membrane protein assembly factor BamB
MEANPTLNSRTSKQGGSAGGLKLLALIAAIAFLAFVAGGVTTYMRTPSVHDFMRRISMVLSYYYYSSRQSATFDPFWEKAHMPGPEGDTPVVLNDTALAGKGYNLVVSSNAQEAVLIDMDGNAIHKWARRFDEIWTKAPQLEGYEEEGPEYWTGKIYWRRAHLYPNGDILVVFETPYRTPYGLGLAKLDKDSQVIWKIDQNIHHDIAVAPNSDIYLLGHSINQQGYTKYPRLKPPFVDDTVVIATPEGAVRKEISIFEAFLESEYVPFMALLQTNLLGDVMHTNSVQYIDAETAEKFAFAEEGQVLISMREMNTIAVLDPTREKIVWAATGLWRWQHEPVMMENGRILIFDNKGNWGGGGATRIIEFDPAKGSIDWSFAGSAEEPLNSPVYGSVQRLASGNTMIVESTNGRAMEVTPGGKVVWDFRSPHRKTEEGQELVMPLMDMVRFAPDALTFLE